MKIGDRVIYENHDIFSPHVEKATIIRIIDEDRIQIRLERINASGQAMAGEKMPWWCSAKNLAIDKEWLREQKLKELGI